MTRSTPLSQFFRIKPRFARSVNIVHDYADERSLDGYIVTPLARSILGRLASSLSHQRRSRAWSITGPYGTGKSACCLFMSSCLSPPADVMGKKARAALRRADGGLSKQAFGSRSPLARAGLVPVLVGGSRRPIVEAIMEAMKSTASGALGSGKNARRLKAAVSRGLRDTTSGKDVSAERIVELLVELAKGVASKKANLGLVLVIDELGKLLEYAAVHPDRSDVFVLQALAEAASRSGRIPMLIVTVLHQAFDRYAAHLGSQERQEWAKVQGRFEDIGFLEPRDRL